MCCVVCESKNIRLIAKCKHQDLGDIVKCNDCNLLFTSYLPTDEVIGKIYNGLYRDRAMLVKINIDKVEQVKKSVDEYFRFYTDLNPGKENISFLDLAGGLGYSCFVAKEYTSDITLVEMDVQSSEFAVSKLGLDNVINKTLEDFFDSNERTYDLIIFRHVIEHLKHPVEVMQQISRLLNDKGVLILETPNSDSKEALIYQGLFRNFFKNIRKDYDLNIISFVKNKVFHLRPPIHLFLYNPRNLAKLINQNGLEVSKSFTYSFNHKVYWQNKLTKQSLFSRLLLKLIRNNMNIFLVAQKK